MRRPSLTKKNVSTSVSRIAASRFSAASAPVTAPPASFLPPLPLRLSTPSSIALSTSACDTPSGRSTWPALRLPFSTLVPSSDSSETNGGTISVSTHGDQRDPGHDHEQRRRALVHPAVAQAVRERHEQRRQQQRDDDRHDDEQQLARGVADRERRDREHEHPPRDRRGDREAARDAVRRPVEPAGRPLAGAFVADCVRAILQRVPARRRGQPRALRCRPPDRWAARCCVQLRHRPLRAAESVVGFAAARVSRQNRHPRHVF